MSASFALSGAPPNALMIWADSKSIYVELPSKNPSLPPCILSFRRDSVGLAKIVNLIYGNAEVAGPIQNYVPNRKLVGTIPQHNLAQAVLRRNRIIK